jgi:hypothetical protein
MSYFAFMVALLERGDASQDLLEGGRLELWRKTDGHERAVVGRVRLSDGMMGNPAGDEACLELEQRSLAACSKHDGVDRRG